MQVTNFLRYTRQNQKKQTYGEGSTENESIVGPAAGTRCWSILQNMNSNLSWFSCRWLETWNAFSLRWRWCTRWHSTRTQSTFNDEQAPQAYLGLSEYRRRSDVMIVRVLLQVQPG